jgi:hypothetical protein
LLFGFFSCFTLTNNLAYTLFFSLIFFCHLIHLDAGLDYILGNWLFVLAQYTVDSFMGYSFMIFSFFIIVGLYGRVFNYFFFIFYSVEDVHEFDDTDELVEINGSLLNGLLSIHPWLLFVSYAFLAYFILVSSSSLFTLYFSDTVFFKAYNSFLFIIIFAIVLGSI